jgi:hypothetical protein
MYYIDNYMANKSFFLSFFLCQSRLFYLLIVGVEGYYRT